MGLIIKAMYNIQGIFCLTNAGSLPAPLGVEIENEGDDIVYLDASLDKWSMRGDRMRIFNDLDVAIKETKK